jgi:hypothetical protein
MATESAPRPLIELQDSGLLWLINRTVFHPRGFSLGLGLDGNGNVICWKLYGDGSEPWTMDSPEPQFEAAEATLAAQREA